MTSANVAVPIDVVGGQPKSIQRWCFVAYDQLHLDLGPWGDRGRDGMPRTQVGLILIETPWKARFDPTTSRSSRSFSRT